MTPMARPGWQVRRQQQVRRLAETFGMVVAAAVAAYCIWAWINVAAAVQP